MKKALISLCWRTLGVLALCTVGAAGAVHAADLRVMKTGLGEGTITSASGINCGTGSATCNATGLTGTVTLNVTVGAGSTFTGWGGDCASVTVVPPSTPPCNVDMNALRSVRANFAPATPISEITDFSPAGLETYLNTNTRVDTAAEFVAALPPEFRENWLLMSRSESLQTGTARFPRILLSSADATRVFTVALDTHPSYPAAHPNAIEYMQFVGGTDNNFHFHEIVLAPIPAQGDDIDPGPAVVPRHPPRTRGTDPVKDDDPRCFACHSTRNVLHRGGTTPESNTPGTTGNPVGSVKFKAKPNWDTYDSWGGMLAFNRDRIYRGTVEAAAFRRTFNLWTWQNNDATRAVVEQLELQPANVPTEHRITRWDTPPLAGGANDGHIQFAFDPAPPAVVTQEPQPGGGGPTVAYNFDRRAGTTGSSVLREASEPFITLHHPCQPASDEGRGVELFDRLTGGRPSGERVGPSCPAPVPGDTTRPNPDRIADELISHRYATGNIEIDVRPIALAIASTNGCITVSGGTDIGDTQSVAGVSTSLGFFDDSNGMSFNDVYDDTRRRAQSLTRRKADIERTTLDRDADLYVYDPSPFDGTPIADTPDRVDGLIRQYGDGTLGINGGTGGQDRSFPRLRQEVFRRDLPPGHYDETVIGRFYVDREDDSTDKTSDNTAPVALYRYFLEPLGISVDKWSMGVRGRSRTYTFADVFGNYTGTLRQKLAESLGLSPTVPCATLMPLVNAQLARLPARPTVPTYTDLQRIFNKGCIECHGGLGYPPYHTYGTSLDLTENETPRTGERRLWRSLTATRARTGAPSCAPGVPTCPNGMGTDPLTSGIYRRITDSGSLRHPYSPGLAHNFTNPDDPANPDVADERCPSGLMPCEGPPISRTDIETIRRWILGGHPNTEGDPHIKTVDGVHYDFQSAGEFILLRGEGLELQARQTPVTTAAPVGPDPHTGLTSCVSINTAVAMRIGLNRVTYQPELAAVVDEADGELAARRGLGQVKRLRLRVDGKEVDLGADGVVLSSGGRITRTTVPDGIEVHVPGGEGIVVTPAWWDYYQVWYMNIEVRHARSTEGVMGVIPPGTWLPALSNGALVGTRPPDLAQRHRALYETFANSWRVDDKNSLFDYEAGLSPRAFVIEKWPVSEAQQCVAPPHPGGPAVRVAPPAIPRAEAEQLCQGIIEPERRLHCIQDVMATGEPGFARIYGATEALQRRVMPGPPVLVSPQDHVRVAGKPVELKWAPRPGAEVIDVVYRACVWNSDENFDFNRCVKLPGGSGLSGDSLAGRLKHRFGLLLWLVLLLLLVLAVLLMLRYRGRGVLVALLLVALAMGLLLVLARASGPGPRTTYAAKVVAGKEHSWKVISETRDGVFVESETYRFEVEP